MSKQRFKDERDDFIDDVADQFLESCCEHNDRHQVSEIVFQNPEEIKAALRTKMVTRDEARTIVDREKDAPGIFGAEEVPPQFCSFFLRYAEIVEEPSWFVDNVEVVVPLNSTSLVVGRSVRVEAKVLHDKRSHRFTFNHPVSARLGIYRSVFQRLVYLKKLYPSVSAKEERRHVQACVSEWYERTYPERHAFALSVGIDESLESSDDELMVHNEPPDAGVSPLLRSRSYREALVGSRR